MEKLPERLTKPRFPCMSMENSEKGWVRNVEIENGRWLMCIPRSGVGFKYRIRLDNTVGNIDADYYMNENNEGEICLKLTNCGTKDYEVKYNDRILQAVFVPFGITYDDEPISEIRTGGFGSTGVK